MEKFICFFHNNYTWSDASIIAISIAILVFAILIPHRVSKKQVIAQLLQEYRSTEMGVAIKKLWDLADLCRVHNSKIDVEYKRIYYMDEMRCSTIQQWQDTLHFARRKISQFYQQLSTLGFPTIRRVFLKNFSTGDLKIIRILFAIERRGIQVKDIKESEINTMWPDTHDALDCLREEQEPLEKDKTWTSNSIAKIAKLYKKSRWWLDKGLCERQLKRQLKRL